MKIDFTLRRFPVTGSLKQQCGLPFSCVVQPFANIEGPGQVAGQDAPSIDDVERCTSCFSYVNCYSTFNTAGWTCSLCGKLTSFKPYVRSRYQVPQEQLAKLSEVCSHAYEAAVGEPLPIEAGPKGFSGPAPVYLALVDLGAAGPGGGPEFVELVRSSLEAALEALPPASLFGLITFSDKIALHDLRSASPTARVLPLAGPLQLPVPLSEVMPLKALLAPVAAFKERIAEALEGLLPDPGAGGAPSAAAPPPAASMTRSGPAQPQGPAPCRALGPALLAVLDYLRALQHPPFVQPAAAAGHAAGAAGAQAMAGLLPPAVSPLHLMLFLSGPPDLGPGRLFNPRKHRSAASAAAAAEAGVVRAPAQQQQQQGAAAAAEQLRLLALQQEQERQYLTGEAYSPDTKRFYEGAAVAATSLGACVDVFAVSPGLVGLPALEPLCNSTGGAIYLYPSADESALPQDVYRRLSGQRASAGLLRVRTSPGFRPARFYGRLFADGQYENLHHIIACDAADTFAIDLEHTSKMGFAAEDVVLQPTIQIAFQYSSIVPHVEEQANGAAAAPEGGHVARLALQRRLRVVTLRMSVTRDPMDLYRHCSSDAVLCLLMHKVAHVTQSSIPQPISAATSSNGTAAESSSTPQLAQARVLLRDWLVLLAAGYQRALHPRAEPRQLAALQPDLEFSEAPVLRRLPRLVYALLRSPLLAAPPEGQHPDLTPFMRHLWACLPPGELQAAVYPALSSWGSPEAMVQPQHPLSRASLHAPGAPPLFLLDAYIVVMVLLTAGAARGAPFAFPPPQSTALAKAIASIRQGRRISPRVRFVREGSEEAEVFFQLLLDEPEDAAAGPGAQAEGSSSQFGLAQFLDHIRSEVALHLASEVPQGQQ